jgi:hypothetical protein
VTDQQHSAPCQGFHGERKKMSRINADYEIRASAACPDQDGHSF